MARQDTFLDANRAVASAATGESCASPEPHQIVSPLQLSWDFGCTGGTRQSQEALVLHQDAQERAANPHMENALSPEEDFATVTTLEAPAGFEAGKSLDDIDSLPSYVEPVMAKPGETAAATNGMVALESTALKATFWTVIDYGGSMALRILNSLVLTRLLPPAAFGEVTLVTTVIVGVQMLTDIGLTPSVIQSRRGDDPRFLNTAWTLQSLRGGVLWLFALLLAWPASLFYKDPSLLYILPVLALGVLITGLYSTNLLTLSRHMGVRRIFFIDISTQVVSLVLTIGWALKWPSVWALVAGNIGSNVYKLVLSHHAGLVPGIRNRFDWDKTAVKEIVHFGKWIVVGTAFFFFAMQSDKLILGKLVSFTLLGVYGIAYNLSDVPRQVINAFSFKVGYPFIAKMIHLPMAEFRVKFLRYRQYTLLAGALLLSLMVNWGDLLVTKLYRPAFYEAAWMVPILALGLWHTLLYMTTSPVLLSLGKSKYNAVGNAVFCVAIVIGIPLGFFWFGIRGAVIAVAAGDFPFYLVNQFGAVKSGVRPLRQDLQMTICFLALVALGYGLRHSFR
jgi:O-antigen/teichoic acid export membrane protein